MSTAIILGAALLVLVTVSTMSRPTCTRYPGERRRELARLIRRTRCRGEWE